MRKIIILIFAIALMIITYNHYDKKIVNKEKNTKDNAQISYRIEENLITTEQNIQNCSEEELINYIKDINNEVEKITTKEKLSNNDKITLKNTFITITNFIFYKGQIKGKTFDELSNTVKENIIFIYEKIDSKIEGKIPDYKESIKASTEKKYNNIKEKLSNLKSTIISSYKNDIGETNYKEQEEIINENINTMKESVSPVIDIIVDKSKEVYNKTKEEANNWYQTWKEENIQ